MNTNMNSQVNEEKTKITRKQKELIKKYAIFGLMGLICAGSIFLLFSPTSDEKVNREAQSGFNTDIPLPKEEGLIGDKRTAYEQEQMKQKQSERMRTLQDFSALINDKAQNQTDDLSLETDYGTVTLTESIGRDNSLRYSQPSSIEQSAKAYQDINRSLGNFYERPREDPEKEQLKQELEELKMRMEEAENRKNTTVDDQLDLMEKSFQMASKYMPGMSGTTPTAGFVNAAETSATSAASSTEINHAATGMDAIPVAQVQERTVSSLQNEMSDGEFIEMFLQPRNTGFLTVSDETKAGQKNTISACIHNDQTIMNGQNVRLRLLEPVHVRNMVIPRNTLLSGTAKIQGERLEITVKSLENDGTVLSVGLTVYDLDGQSGIFIPNMQELNAAKEVVANLGTNAGTSINLSNDAEKQFIADMGRNVIQGVSQFTAKKLREVKVHLKAGYRVYLISDENLKTGNQPQLANR